MENNNENGKFNAEKFVDHILSEGFKIPCDETSESFNNDEGLPAFYNEDAYKSGQKFFNDNIFALFYGKLLGLLSVLTIPSILKILIHTKMSGSPMTAYKRYMSTIFHMCIWYQDDFKPGSELWMSITDVKNKHNSASKRGCAAGLNRINQKDMVLTQFGFMGYAIAKREQIGLHNIKDQDWHGFVHVWRVVGSIMGIEDRFNICRESVEETTEICRTLIDKVFRPAMESADKDFTAMATYLVQGLWAMNPTLEVRTYIALICSLLQPSSNIQNNNPTPTNFPPLEINNFVRFHLAIHRFVTWTLQFTIFRWYHNYVQFMTLWIMKVFPFLAYYKFGRANAHVTILPDARKTR